MVSDLGRLPRHRLRFAYLSCTAEPPARRQVSGRRREERDSGRAGARRTTKVEGAALLRAASDGKLPRLAPGFDLLGVDSRHVYTDPLGAAAGQIVVEFLFQ